MFKNQLSFNDGEDMNMKLMNSLKDLDIMNQRLLGTYQEPEKLESDSQFDHEEIIPEGIYSDI